MPPTVASPVHTTASPASGAEAGPENALPQPKATQNPPAQSTPEKVAVLQSELVLITDTPHKKKETFEFKTTDLDVLSDTIAYQLEYVHWAQEEIKRITATGAIPPSIDLYLTGLHKKFLEVVKERNPDLKLDDHEAIKTFSDAFIQEGGASIRTALKFIEWEELTLEEATAIRFEKKGKDKTSDVKDKTKKVYVRDESGMHEVDKKMGIWESWKAPKHKRIISQEYVIERGSQINRTTGLTVPQQKFLESKKWIGTSTATPNLEQLSDLQAEGLRQRFVELTQTSQGIRKEIFSKTGKDPNDIKLNFILSGSTPGAPVYDTLMPSYLIGEALPAGTVASLEQTIVMQGEQIVKEIKDKTDKKLRKVLEKARGASVEEYELGLLDVAIKKSSETLMTPEEKVVQEAEINLQLKDLARQLGYFSRKRSFDLGFEESVVQKERQTAEDELKKRMQEVNVVDPTIPTDLATLLSWSEEVTNPESWKALELKFNEEKAKVSKLEKSLKDNQDKFDKLEEALSQLSLDIVEKTDASGNRSVTTQDPKKIKLFDTRLQRLNYFDTEIKRLEDLLKNYLGTPSKSADEVLQQMEKEFNKRKNVVTDDELTKGFIAKYREKKEAERKLGVEKTEVITQVVALTNVGTTEDTVRARLKDQTKLKENLGKTAENMLENDSLEAIKVAKSPNGIKDTELRVRQMENGILGDEIRCDKYWEKYPKAIIRLIQVMYGDDVLSPAPNDEKLAQQVKKLFKSKKYLDKVIESLESGSVTTASVRGGAGLGGEYDSLDNVFIPGADIKTFGFNRITRDVTNDILKKLYDEGVKGVSAKIT